MTMNCQAMDIPRKRLIGELESRIKKKKGEQAELDNRYGAGRIRIASYMENIGWPELFGYDMNRYFQDAAFCIEQELRQRIFWCDNVDDDTIPATRLNADIGMYWDSTLFGQQVRHTSTGVPEFGAHPLQEECDIGCLGDFQFDRSGAMPLLLRKYEAMKAISAREYSGALEVMFPSFHRGPLDIYVQLRGYENFLCDTVERPGRLREALDFIVAERLRFSRERMKYLGESCLPGETYVADDWVNIPFISPAIFRDFIVPAYRRIRENEGVVAGFHTCGKMAPIVCDLLAVFPEMNQIEVSGWNDIEEMDRIVGRHITFRSSIINTVTLSGSEKEQRKILEAVKRVSSHRKVGEICAQAIVRLHDSYEETLGRLGGFIGLCRKVLFN